MKGLIVDFIKKIKENELLNTVIIISAALTGEADGSLDVFGLFSIDVGTKGYAGGVGAEASVEFDPNDGFGYDLGFAVLFGGSLDVNISWGKEDE